MGNMLNTNASGGELALLLTENNGGSRISSTRYLHYGTVTARSEPTLDLPQRTTLNRINFFQSKPVGGVVL